jgi:hypothetical protein
VPIEGATLTEAVDTFRTHLNGVLSQTLTLQPLTLFKVRTNVGVGFRDPHGRPTSAVLTTNLGLMHLALSQVCTSSRTPEGQHRLHTIKYRYALTGGDARAPFVRWEYVKRPGAGRWCRHHVQGPMHLTVGDAPGLLLDDLHLPTGFVTIEEILRFCIVDLGVEPISRRWHEVLEESYERFKADFAPRGGL